MAGDAASLPVEPNLGFEDSRRLTGPNRWLGGPAATLSPLGRAASSPVAQAHWARLVQDVCNRLGWPDPQPRAHTSGPSTTLVFAAPADGLFTATDLNEWAWEEAAAAFGDTGFDRAQPIGPDPAAAARVLAARAATEWRADIAALRLAHAAHAAQAAQAAPDAQAPLGAVAQPADATDLAAPAEPDAPASPAAPAPGRTPGASGTPALPWLLDDEALSIGAGAGSRTWPLGALPTPAAVPWAELHGVPTVLVTGSNGKTTTVRLLAAIARAAGLRPGFSSTEGVVVGDETVHTGDYAGPAGARAVLRHPQVQAAILETARGGILRRGLAVAQADVAVVTRIAADHLGEYGVHSARDLAETKLAVAHAVQHGGTLVLNADCPLLMAAADVAPHATTAAAAAPASVPATATAGAGAAAEPVAAPATARRALFARAHGHPALVALRATGGSTCALQHGRLLLAHAGVLHDLGAADTLPLALGGAAAYNLDNACAAALAAACLGWPPQAIRAALQGFGASPLDNPGRLERWPWRGATVLIDYAHNPDGLAELLAVAQALQPRRLGLLLGQAGNRDDDAIGELARTAAAARPARVVLKELPGMLRGRQPGEVPALLARALQAAGLPPASLMPLLDTRAGAGPGAGAGSSDEHAAALALLAWAQPGDVLVLPLHEAASRDAVRTHVQHLGAPAGPG